MPYTTTPPSLVGKNTQVEVLFDTVSIKIICGSDYEAQVLFDDVVTRVQAGEKLTIGLSNEQIIVK